MEYKLLSNNNNYPTHHHWFPKMCSCVDGGSTETGCAPDSRGRYRRLASVPTWFQLSNLRRAERELDNEKQEELRFYNENETYQTVVVEKNLCASDLCQLLALKNRVGRDISWSIVESWPEIGLERTLEDHEDVLRVHRDMESFGAYEGRFIFRQDFPKYEFFHNPQQFFPPDMVDFMGSSLGGAFVDRNAVLQNLLARGPNYPPVFSSAWIRDEGKNVWAKVYMVLKGKKLYITPKVQLVSRVIRQWRHRSESHAGGTGAISKRPAAINTDQLEVLARLPDYHIYVTPNAKKHFRAPTEWGICLRPASNAEAEETPGSELRCITFESEKSRSCWIIAMRLAKYGKQLRENYRAFKNKQCEPTGSSTEYSSYSMGNDSLRSRVAMDFTGNTGRVVDDPQEARAIALAEGMLWKQQWKPPKRTQSRKNMRAEAARARGELAEGGRDVEVRGIEPHLADRWFHSGMTRDQAASLVGKHGTVDGVFIVRESRSNRGAYVLTYKYGGKVLHTQIREMTDPMRSSRCYSMDNGVTKFYELSQLIEFHQLNLGSLPTRLTHYVVTTVSGPALKTKGPYREEMAVPSLTTRLSSGHTSMSTSIIPARTPTPTTTRTITPSITPSLDPSSAPSLAPSTTPPLAPSTTPPLASSITPPLVPSITPPLVPSVTPPLVPSPTPPLVPSLALPSDPSVAAAKRDSF